MTTDDIYVPLKLIECEGGRLRGKVRLQKPAFLVQAECGAVDYGFQPAPLGPRTTTAAGIARRRMPH